MTAGSFWHHHTISDPEIKVNNYGSLSMINVILISQALKEGIPPEQQSSVTVSFEAVVALPSMSTSVEEIIEHAFKKLSAALSGDAITVHFDVALYLLHLYSWLEKHRMF